MKEPKKMGLLERKKFERSVRRRKQRIKIGIIVSVVAVALIVVCVKFKPWEKLSFGSTVQTGGNIKNNKNDKNEKAAKRLELIESAERMAESYGYDEAVDILKGIDGYEKDEEVQGMISDIQAEKAACVPVKLEEVTHIFYHSLVVDEERAFKNQANDTQAAGNNQWMTTIDEFNAITQEMYDRGYVMVSIHDLYEVTKDENGKEVWKEAEILLPEGKKAFVMSMDDLSFYHAYDNYGFAA